MSLTCDPSMNRWLLLVHQLPAKPDYLRVKIGRKLARMGAVAVKNSVYVLPNDPERVDELQFLLREIADGGGEGTLAEATLLGGLDDARVEEMFRAARDEETAPVLAEARSLVARGAPGAEDRSAFAAELARLRRRNEELAVTDFFGSPARAELTTHLRAAEGLLRPTIRPAGVGAFEAGRTWVTRRGLKIDRLASAWLVRRFLDPEATFRFVDGVGHTPAPGEVRFDMYDAEYTHEGDACTFEVLQRRFAADDGGLAAIGEIVHDIDIKDGKYGRPETPGIALMIEAIAAAHADDLQRLARASAVFDDLYAAGVR